MGLSTGETDIVNPGFGGGFGGMGGMGGFGLVGLIGLNSFLGRGGLGGGEGFDGRGGAGNVVLEQNVSNIREEIGTLGNEVQSAFATQNLGINGQFTALGNRLCESEKSSLTAAFQATIQGMTNTQSIKDQATANQIIAAENACAIKGLVQAEADATRALVHAETDRTIALINQIETQNLRDRILALERRGDQREVEINIQNTANATQAQLQNQNQQQQQQFASFANLVSDQLARQANSIVNLGTMTASGQSNNAAQTKVNS